MDIIDHSMPGEIQLIGNGMYQAPGEIARNAKGTMTTLLHCVAFLASLWPQINEQSWGTLAFAEVDPSVRHPSPYQPQSRIRPKKSRGSMYFSHLSQSMGGQQPRPNSCTYWVDEVLLAGEYPTVTGGDQAASRCKLRAYLECGITHFIDLTNEGEKPSYQELLRELASEQPEETSVTYQRIPIQDFGIPTVEQMTEILDAIEDAGRKGQKVYVHCRGGIGRTGTTAGCYLARKYSRESQNIGKTRVGAQALADVNRLFLTYSDRSRQSSCSPETGEQMRFVEEWSD